MFCMYCGAAVPNAAAFCPACGRQIAGEPASVKESPADKELIPSVCKSCGSNSLKRVRRGEYLCEHCGSRFFTDAKARAESGEETESKLAAIFAEAVEFDDRRDYKAELETLVKGLDIAPDNCTLLLKLGRVNRRMGFPKEALEYYRRAEAADPENPIIYVNMATLYIGQGQTAQARPLLEKAIAMIEADPLSAPSGDITVTYGNYALCLGKLGDRAGAKKYLRKAKELGCSKDEIKDICRQIGLNAWLI